MLTPLFVLIRICANPVSNVFQKKLTRAAAQPVFVILATYFFLALAVAPVLFWLGPLKLSVQFWLNLGLCIGLAVSGNALIVAALKSTDLSVLGPLNSYKAIVSLILGIFLLGEFPTLLGLVGILLIVAGSALITEKAANQSTRGAFRQLFSNRGVQLRLAALVFSATEAVFLKKVLLLSSPLVTFVFWCLCGLPVAGLLVALALRTGFRAELTVLRQKKSTFLALALTTGLMQLSTLYTFGALQVGAALALFQISTLLSVFFGYHFFQEKDLLRRLLGASIMVAGAIFIIVFGS